MKTFEWVIAIFLVLIGLFCMTVSGTLLMEPNSIGQYIHTLIKLCLWMGIPIFIVGLIYYVLLVKKRRENKKGIGLQSGDQEKGGEAG
jgi:membrane-anchored glycerophosphoryl diester phosphodiesterase (GDPDase)